MRRHPSVRRRIRLCNLGGDVHHVLVVATTVLVCAMMILLLLRVQLCDGNPHPGAVAATTTAARHEFRPNQRQLPLPMATSTVKGPHRAESSPTAAAMAASNTTPSSSSPLCKNSVLQQQQQHIYQQLRGGYAAWIDTTVAAVSNAQTVARTVALLALVRGLLCTMAPGPMLQKSSWFLDPAANSHCTLETIFLFRQLGTVLLSLGTVALGTLCDVDFETTIFLSTSIWTWELLRSCLNGDTAAIHNDNANKAVSWGGGDCPRRFRLSPAAPVLSCMAMMHQLITLVLWYREWEFFLDYLVVAGSMILVGFVFIAICSSQLLLRNESFVTATTRYNRDREGAGQSPTSAAVALKQLRSALVRLLRRVAQHDPWSMGGTAIDETRTIFLLLRQFAYTAAGLSLLVVLLAFLELADGAETFVLSPSTALGWAWIPCLFSSLMVLYGPNNDGNNNKTIIKVWPQYVALFVNAMIVIALC
jgi:hypothetical protein